MPHQEIATLPTTLFSAGKTHGVTEDGIEVFPWNEVRLRGYVSLEK